jgi:hypothetical protein
MFFLCGCGCKHLNLLKRADTKEYFTREKKVGYRSNIEWNDPGNVGI